MVPSPVPSCGIADLVLFSTEVSRFCSQREIPLTARGSATSSLAIWALGLAELCPLDYGLDGRMFVHDGRDDLPDLDLEVSSLHETAVSAFVQQGGFDHSDSERDSEFPRLRTLRVGIHVSLGARQAVRSAGAALGMEPPRVNSVARQVPLLSSPGAIDNVMMHAPELGIADAGAGVEPYNTLVRVAGQLEGCHTVTVPTRRRTRFPSLDLARWHGCRRRGCAVSWANQAVQEVRHVSGREQSCRAQLVRADLKQRRFGGLRGVLRTRARRARAI